MRLLTAFVTACVLGISPAHATTLSPGYQDICREANHPKWAYGKEGTPVQFKPLFGCDERFGARRDADERFVEKLQESGKTGAALSWELVRRGWNWIGQRKPAVALNRFNLAFEADPDNGDVYHGIAVVMAETGQTPEVIGYWFEQAVAKERGQAGRFADYGRFLTMSGRLDEALPVLEKSLKLEPFNAWTLANISSLHLHRQQPQKACPFMIRIASTSPPQGYPKAEFDRFQAHWAGLVEEHKCEG